MYTLYYSPGACSMAVHVLLNELGVPFKSENANKPGTKDRSESFLKISPRGTVPVLADGDQYIKEGAAIMLYLTHQHPTALLPREGQAYAKALEWLMFANATLHPAYSRGFFFSKQLQEKAADSPLMKATITQINTLWAEVDQQLAKTDYVCGKECTMADILLTVIANWSGNFKGIELGSHVKRMLKSVIARPSYQKALQAEQVEYKAAA